MYKDIIHYKLADGVTEEYLLDIAKQIVTSWMNKQPGFIKWEINKDNEGGYTDIVYWESKQDAKNSEADMGNIPNVEKWYNCYDRSSISSSSISQLTSFEN